MLPKLPNRDQIKKAQTITFGGINRNPAAPDGSVFQTKNMGSDRMPCLSPRKPRYRIGQYDGCSGIFAYNGLYMVDGATISKDGNVVGFTDDTREKMFAAMNDQIIMFPDKLLIDTDGTEVDAGFVNRRYIREVPVHFLQDPDMGYSIIELRDDGLDWYTLGVFAGDEITVEGHPFGGNDKTATVKYGGRTQLCFQAGTFTAMADQTINITKEMTNGSVVTHFSADFQPPVYSETLGMDVCWLHAHDTGIQWSAKGIKAGDKIRIQGSTIPANNRYATVLWAGRYDLAFPYGTFAPCEDQILTIYYPFTSPLNLVKPLEVSVDATAVFQDGTIYGEPAEKNTIKWTEGVWGTIGLKVGDAVTVTGSGEEKNNDTFIIREIEGSYLRFDENVFELTPQEGGEPEETETITVTRKVPDLDGMFTHENRLWGYKGNTIYASKLGDPSNFNVYDGLEDDSWTWEMDGSGDILGAIVYQGYPMFFKEDKVVRIYGDRPSQYRSMDVSAMGIHPGCGESLAIAGDTLYYVSRNGMAAYNGGYSRDVHEPFGELRFIRGKAVSDGRRYYLSAYDGESWSLYVYDTVWDCWFREDGQHLAHAAWDRGNLYLLFKTTDGKHRYLWLDGHATSPPENAEPEGTIYSEVEFGDFTGNYWTNGRGYGNPSRKGTSKIQIRATLNNAALTVWIAYDGGERIKVGSRTEEGKNSYYLAIIPRRSDHYRIYLEGAGDWTLNSLVREEYSGSDIH